MGHDEPINAEELFSFDDYDKVIGFVISQAADLLARRLNRIIERNGISITNREFVIINRLHQHGSLTQGQLANLSYKDPAATSRLVESLRKKGMLRRKACANDRRVTHVTLTDKGAAARAIIAPQLSDMLRQATANSSEADLLATYRVLKTMVDMGGTLDVDRQMPVDAEAPAF